MLTILIVVGVALSCVGIFGLVIYGGQKKKLSHITKAKIVKVDVSTKRSGADKWEEIRPTLEYQVKGKRYRIKYDAPLSESWKREDTFVGKTIDIAYSPSDPTYIKSLSNDKGRGIYSLFFKTSAGVTFFSRLIKTILINR